MRSTREGAIEALTHELQGFNRTLVADSGRQPVLPVAHAQLADVVLIPSAPPVQPAVAFRADLKSIIVDRLCGEAVLRGSDIFARGIMSASSGLNADDRVNIFVDLDHLTTRGRTVDDHKGRKLLIAHGTTCMARTEMFRATRGLAITSIVRVCHDAPPMNGMLSGDIYVQNLPSTIVAHELNPQPGDVIIDMCAAPGGKTSHVATLMKDTGILVCCDRSKKKALGLKALFDELVFRCVVPLKMDSTHSVLPKSDDPVLSVAQVIEMARHKAQKGAQLLIG